MKFAKPSAVQFQQALLEHKRAGNPIAVSEDDQVAWIQPEQIKVYPMS